MQIIDQIKLEVNRENELVVKLDIDEALDKLFYSTELKDRTVHYRTLTTKLYCLGLINVRTEGWLTTLKWGLDTDEWTTKNRMNAYNSLRNYLIVKGVLV